MTRTEYFENAQTLLADGKVSEEVFWAMIENADVFANEDKDDEEE